MDFTLLTQFVIVSNMTISNGNFMKLYIEPLLQIRDS